MHPLQKRVLFLVVFGILYVYYLQVIITRHDVSSAQKQSRYVFNESDLDKSRTINFLKEDVLVYLHVQKTGGSTFGRNLVQNIDIDTPCKCTRARKRCDCRTSNNRMWLYNKGYSGMGTGHHADWTELHECVDEWFQKNDVMTRTNRRYHYLTYLRNPQDRFLSEWKHVRKTG